LILGISEFTFGFAFLHEQTTSAWNNLVAAPILPSLQEENLVGWDAKLPRTGTDFYYQFKLSDYLWTGNAKFIRDGTYDAPYFRIALHKKDNNRQHQRLREHSRRHPETYYVAPEVNALEDFNSAFLSRQLTQNSRIIPVSQCKDITDGDQHYITFRQGDSTWMEHSNKVVHHDSFTGKDLESVYRRALDRKSRPIQRELYVDIYNDVRDLAVDQMEREEKRFKSMVEPLLYPEAARDDSRGLLLRTSDILAAVFGLTLVLVGEKR
jgi:hypothetical protein